MKDESLEAMKQAAGAEQRGVQLRGNWLLFARLSWVIVALFSLSYFLFSFDATFSATFGFSRGVFAPQGFGNTLLTVDRSMLWILCPVLWCAIGALVFWQSSRKRKSSGDFMVLFVSLTLVVTGLSLPSLLQIGGIASPPTHLERVVRIVVATLGNDCLLLLLFLFPDGRFAPRWISVPIVALLLLAFCVNFFDVPLLSSWFIGFGSPLSLLVNVVGLTSLLSKYRRVSTPRQRRQTRLAVLGLLVFWGPILLPN